MFRAGLLLIIRRYYSVYITIGLLPVLRHDGGVQETLKGIQLSEKSQHNQ